METRDDCLFCQILAGKKPARMVYQDEVAVAFEDIRPQAPIHVLIVPRKHLLSLNDAASADEPVLGRLMTVAAKLARERKIENQGYRIVINNGRWAGQSVDHLHVHLLGGRVFHWPPG